MFSLILLIVTCACVCAQDNSTAQIDENLATSDSTVVDDDSDDDGTTGDESFELDLTVGQEVDVKNETEDVNDTDSGSVKNDKVSVDLQMHPTGNPIFALIMLTIILLPFRRHL